MIEIKSKQTNKCEDCFFKSSGSSYFRSRKCGKDNSKTKNKNRRKWGSITERKWEMPLVFVFFFLLLFFCFLTKVNRSLKQLGFIKALIVCVGDKLRMSVQMFV